MMTLEGAIALSCNLHAGQRDMGGEPYIMHILRVMEAVPPDRIYQYTALMHDAAEDGHISLVEVKAHFGLEIAQAVEAITRRPDERYLAYIQRAKSHNIARIVKLADLADNLSPARRGAISESQRERYELARALLLSRNHDKKD